MSELQLWDLIVTKDGNEKKVLISALAKQEAIDAMAEWKKIFNADVFFEPVPTLSLAKHTTRD